MEGTAAWFWVRIVEHSRTTLHLSLVISKHQTATWGRHKSQRPTSTSDDKKDACTIKVCVNASAII